MPRNSDSVLRRSATVTETDMRAFEGALEEKWCHITPLYDDGTQGASYFCGMPVVEPTHPDCEDINGRCVICNRLACPDCERVWSEGYA